MTPHESRANPTILGDTFFHHRQKETSGRKQISYLQRKLDTFEFMKAAFICFFLSATLSLAQNNSSDDNENRTVAPSPVPPPTDFPTPEGPFQYMPWGETNFGFHYKDLYYWGFQHAIRRPGWSWNEPLAGYGPFCYGDKCHPVTSACETYGGTLLNEHYCSFPEDVKIVGPSCWEGECTATGRDTCGEVGGITIGDSQVEWCLFKGPGTVFGPACYNGYVIRIFHS